MFSYKFCSSGHGNGIHCDYLTNFFQFSLTNPQISHGTLLKLNVDSKDLWNLEKLLKKDVIFGIYSSNFRVCFPLNQNALLAPRKPFTTMEYPTIWRYWRCISYETWWMFQRFMSPFREVCVSLRKKRCHHPKGKKTPTSTTRLIQNRFHLPKVTSVAAQQLNQLAAVGHAAPWALKDGGMVGWFSVGGRYGRSWGHETWNWDPVWGGFKQCKLW